MASFDYDVLNIGSGFGGSVAALATEALNVYEAREVAGGIRIRA